MDLANATPSIVMSSSDGSAITALENRRVRLQWHYPLTSIFVLCHNAKITLRLCFPLLWEIEMVPPADGQHLHSTVARFTAQFAVEGL